MKLKDSLPFFWILYFKFSRHQWWEKKLYYRQETEKNREEKLVLDVFFFENWRGLITPV